MEALEACECPVCFNEFNEEQYVPLATVCGHTICQNCIQLLEKDNSEYGCPLCRNTLQKGSCKVNVALRQLIKELWKLRQTRDGVPLTRSPSVLDIPYSDIALDELIDSGAFGEVYTARWHGNRVAVKILRGAQITEKSRASFQREVYVMNCLRHPNIVLLLGACQTPPHLSIVMELLLGGSLHHMIHNNGKMLALKEVQQVALDVACGLQYLHGINILHRDLKGKNVLLTNDEFPCQAKLCDFGLARMRQETATMTGNIGTVHWTAPEIMNNKRYRFSADVYSLGMVLYEMASGKLPFAEMIPMAVMVAVVINKQRPSMDEIKSRHGNEPRLQELIEKCTEWEASQRPSITEVISVLTELIPLETSGRRARMVNQQSCDLQSMTIEGLNVVFVADSSSDLTDTTGAVFETSDANSHNKNVDRKEEFLLGAVGGEANDPDMELALQLQREEDEHYRKQIEQDEALARELQHRDFSYRVPVNSLVPKKMPGPDLMQSIRTFNPDKLNRNVPEAPPPPPLPSPVATPTFQIGQTGISNDSPPRTNVQDSKPLHSNFVATGSPYLKMTSYPGTITTDAYKNLKGYASMPTVGKTQKSNGTIPLPPPPPIIIRHQPSELLREIRGDAIKRQSGHNLGAYQALRHVETIEKRAFRVGKVVGQPVHEVASFPTGEKTQKSDGTIPPPPPLPHLPIRRQPSELLQEIRGDAIKRRSGHNLGAYQGLRHVETIEKRAFRIGKVVGQPMHVVTTQDLVKSFNKQLLNPVDFSEPVPFFPVGQVVRSAPVHVPKMKAHFSPTKKSGFITKKRSPGHGKLKKSPATAPEDELPRIPTPPPLDNIPMPTISKQPPSKKPPPLDDIPMPTKSKQPMSKKSAGLKRKK